MNQTNSTFEAMLKAAISRDSTGATDTMLIHAHFAASLSEPRNANALTHRNYPRKTSSVFIA